MSFIAEARRWSHTITDKLQAVSNQFAAYVADQSTEEGEDITIITEGRLAEDTIKFCEENMTYGALMDGPAQSCLPPFEPDGDKCKLLIPFDGFGKTIPDASLFNREVRGRGVMRLQRGIDYGNGGSYEIVFDGRSTSPYIHDSKVGFARMSTAMIGFSGIFRMQPFRVAQSGGIDTSPWNYKENNDNWFTFEITASGRLYFNVQVQGGASWHIRTPQTTIVPNGRYEVAFSYDKPTDTPKLYVNNVLYTEHNAARAERLPPNNSMNFGKLDGLVSPPSGQEYPEVIDSKLYCGSLQWLTYFGSKVLTATEVSRHYTNKLTIADIPFGRVAYPGLAFCTA